MSLIFLGVFCTCGGKFNKELKVQIIQGSICWLLTSAYVSCCLWGHIFDCRNTKYMQGFFCSKKEVLGFLVSNSTEHNLLNEFMLNKYYTIYSREMRILQQKSTLMLKLFCIINLFYIFSILALLHGWQVKRVCHQDMQGLMPTACHQPIPV